MFALIGENMKSILSGCVFGLLTIVASQVVAAEDESNLHWSKVRIVNIDQFDLKKCAYKAQESCSRPGDKCYEWYKKRAITFGANTVAIIESSKGVSTSSNIFIYDDDGRPYTKTTTNITAIADYYSCPK